MSKEIIKQDSSTQLVMSKAYMPQDMHAIVSRALQPRLVDQDEGSVVEKIKNVVAHAASIAGTNIAAGDQVLHAMEVCQWLKRLYPYVTVPEVQEAVKCGVFGQYGEYFGINAKSIVFFVQCYLADHRRRVALERHQSSQRREGPVIMTLEQHMELIQKDYRAYLRNPEQYIPFLPTNYRILRAMGLIGLKSRESWQIWLYLSKNDKYCREQQTAARNGNKYLKATISKICEDLEQKGEISKDEYRGIIYNARRLRYMKFFEVMAKNEVKDIFTEVDYLQVKYESGKLRRVKPIIKKNNQNNQGI